MNEPQQNEEVERLEVLEGEQPSRRGFFARLLLPVVIVLVLAAGTAAWFLWLKPEGGGIVEPEAIEAGARKPPPFGEVYRINDMIINPFRGRRHFMVSVALEYFDAAVAPELEKREPLIRDNLITFFSAQPTEVLTNIRYRQAIRARVKKIVEYQVGEGTITRVFFDRWVLQ